MGDVALAAMTYPMFASQGVEILKDGIGANQEEMDELKGNKHVRKIFDFIMVPYTGYFSLLLSSTYCCYYNPDCRMPTAMAMFSLILMKKVWLNQDEENDEEIVKSKDNWVSYFYIPFYGAYFAINLYEKYKAKSA